MIPKAVEESSAGAARRWAAARDPVLWGALLLQLALSIPGLASRSLWLDEAYSALLARRSLGEIAATLAHDSGPPLHYWLLSAWRALFGESPAALRSVSLLFALATAVVLYLLVCASLDRRAARVAALLWATSPMAAFYAGEARAYTMLAFLALVLAWALLEPIAGWSWKRFLVIAASALALVYTHNAAWFAIAALLAAAAWRHRRLIPAPTVVAGLLVAIVGFIPWIATLRAQTGNVSWVRQVWSAWSPLASFSGWAPLGWVPDYIGIPQPPLWVWVPCVAIWYTPAVLAVLEAARGNRLGIVSLAVYTVLGLAIPWAMSLAWQPLSLAGRHDFFLLGPVIVLVAAGIGRLRPWVGRMLTAVLVTAGIVSVVLLSLQRPAVDERLWTELIARRGEPGDVVVCTGVTRPVAEYYLAARGFHFVSYPRKMAQDLAHFEEAWYAAHVDLTAEADLVVGEAFSRLGAGNRLWLLASPGDINEPLYRAVDRTGLVNVADVRDPRMGLRRLNQWVAVAAFVWRTER